MVLDYRDRVIDFVKSTGPVLPVQISKEVKTNILMASAMLSEMSSKGTIKISFLKIGGSPLYYLPGQEGMLVNFISGMNEKDKRALDKIQKEKVIRDRDQDALTRVSLRNLKDFAHPLNVTHDGNTEVFWKWFELTDADASSQIKGFLTATSPPQPAQVQPQVTQRLQPAPPTPIQLAPVQPALPISQPEPELPIKDRRKKPRTQKKPKPVVKPAALKIQQAQRPLNLQDPLLQITPPPVQQEPILPDPALSDPFFKSLQSFFERSNIKILEHRQLKKRQEYDLVLQIPSPVGWLVYYAKARNKQKLSDADLNAAFVQGQLKKLPAMLIAPGELTKKGQTLLNTELQGLAFTRLT